MSSVTYFVAFLLGSLLVSNALGTGTSDSWVEGKIQELENAIQQAGCQKYLAHGYRYEHMYYLGGVALDNTVVKRKNNDLVEFEMHIAIKAEKDGIILLSPKSWPGADDLVFEIGIGISNNQYTILRIKKDSSDEVVRVATPGILSTTQYKKFYIILSDDVLTVGVEGESPIINYSDVRMRRISHFDVSAWGSIDAKFLYDCPAPTIN